MMENKEIARILCTVEDTGEHFAVSVDLNGKVDHLLIAFSAIAKSLSAHGISPFMLLRAFMLLMEPDKDCGAG